MNEISSDLVLQKMREALNQLENAVEQGEDTTESAQALKTYSELMIEAGKSRGARQQKAAPPVQHAQISDLEKKPASPEGGHKQTVQKERPPIYDHGDEPESDSLLDF
ncbi:DUF5327 family protein [Salisediminibacterium halotolerans]|uniref:DUF5327 family protein n=1 Tax=Salisediminibacterium halotolerans TaxID=517425 RepID=UPI000EB109E2|nr:DUF5327 family protein [Salisediminibacterium halotolerans]RLJ69654.1 hypothetical protein BCL39_2518 [Actinophytocola xinjiangensis]RPE89712.1 hypothetical protein EDD67_0489 [Salisediminibacterium halotolerans]TWG32548.1 hypothetical protein BCL52_2513 [Salisediminibacterium halotolerans]GEL08439.1 hypothetical protein SHA02_18550 [Salisediminibacterium halotolerans]